MLRSQATLRASQLSATGIKAALASTLGASIAPILDANANPP